MHANALVWRFYFWLAFGLAFGLVIWSFGSVKHLVKIWSFGQALDLIHLVAGFGCRIWFIWFGYLVRLNRSLGKLAGFRRGMTRRGGLELHDHGASLGPCDTPKKSF